MLKAYCEDLGGRLGLREVYKAESLLASLARILAGDSWPGVEFLSAAAHSPYIPILGVCLGFKV